MLRTLLAFVTVSAASGALAQSATQAPPPPQGPPCATSEYRQLDFWVGEWIATWDNGNGTKGTGKNVITRDEYGQCVITERFTADDGSLKGFSISTYFRPAGEWRQTWMDAQGGYFDLFGGSSADPSHKFFLETYRRSERQPYQRMIWQDVKPDSFTWRWQRKASADAPWTDQWVINYTRAPQKSASASK